PFKRCPAAVFENEIPQRIQRGERKLVHHVHQPPVPDFVACGQRVEVADNLVGFAYVVADDVDQFVVDGSAFGKLHDRNEDALFVDFIGVGPEAAATHVDDVSRAGKVANQIAAAE